MTADQSSSAPPRPATSSIAHNPTPTPPMDMPSFPEAEEATLGALMLSPSASDRLLPVLREEHFDHWQNQRVYAAIRDLHDQRRPIDPITVHTRLREKGQTRFGDFDAGVYLANCLEAAYFPGHAIDYAATVLDTAARRKLVYAGTRVVQRASSPAGTTHEVIDDAVQQLHTVREILQQRDALFRLPADTSDGIGL